MIDYQRLFHTGIRVANLDAAMAEMGDTLGVTWATVQSNDAQEVWTPERGLDAVKLSFVYSTEGPQHVELLQGQRGSVWDGSDDPGVHHVGIWVADVAAATDHCLSHGWRLAAAGASPDDGFGAFTYVVPPSGPIVELVSDRVLPVFEQWWGGGRLGGERE